MQSVLRSLRVLEAVAENQPIGVADLARLLELPTSTVQRILVTLREAGWIAPTDDVLTRWSMTARALAVGQKSTHGQSLIEASAAPIRALRDKTQETIHLAVPDGTERMVIIDRADSEQAIRTYIAIGHSSPIHATASGRSVLAALPDSALEEVIGRGLPAVTDRTITDPAQLRERIAAVRSTGYAVVLGENRPQISAIAAAVLDPASRPVAAVAISMPALRYNDALPATWGVLAVSTAKEIANSLRG